MALIKCKECGKEISENAKVCVNCGNPNTLSSKEKKQEVENKVAQDNQAVVITIGIVIVVILSIFFGGKAFWKRIEGNRLLNAVGIDNSNNTLVIHEKNSEKTKDDIMDWLGFEKVEN